MPDQTLDQLNELLDAADADLFYTTRDGLDHKTKLSTIVDGLVEETRQVGTGAGLSGGGDLSADRTVSLDVLSLPENLAPVLAQDYVLIHEVAANAPRRVRLDRLPTNPSQQNTFLNVAVSGQPTIVADGNTDTLNIAAGSNINITTSSVTDTVTIAATGLVPTTRNIGAGAGLVGGGDLSANRSLAVDINGQVDDTAPTLANHFILTHDTTTGSLKKLRASLLGGSSYTLPVATGSVLGGVRIGSGLAVDQNGTVTLNYTMPAATSVSLGGVKVGANLAVSGDGTISANAPYSLPTASAGVLGGVRIGSGLTIDGAGVLSAPAQGGYTLPIATTTTLGGVKQGSNVTIAGDGAISVAAPYTLPTASAGTLGGIRIGTGLAIDGGGIVSVSGGSAYTLPIASSSVLGGIKIGSGVVMAGDGTLSVPPTGGTPNDGVFRPTGIVRGTGLSNAVRNNNRIQIQNAINAMNAQGSGKVALGGGTIEIGGPGTTPDPAQAMLEFTGGHGNVRVFDGEGATLIQTTNLANILKLTGCRHHTFMNLELEYSSIQATGAGFDYPSGDPAVITDPHACIRIRDAMMNKFSNITTRNAWIHICADSADPTGASGGGSYSNCYDHIEINMAANTGWGIAQRKGTGSAFNNIYITGNGTNAPCRGGVIFLGVGQTTFNQLNIEWIKCQKALRLSNCYGIVINSINMEGNTPMPTNAGVAALVHLDSLCTASFHGGTIADVTFDQTTNGVTTGLLFSVFSQSKLTASGMFLTYVKKVGTVRTALLGIDNADNVSMDQSFATFDGITLRRTSTIEHYNLNHLVVHSLFPSGPVTAGSAATTHGPLRRFNNVIGAPFGPPVTWASKGSPAAPASPEPATIIYLLPHGNWQRFNTALINNLSITLADHIDAPLTDATKPVPEVPAGATMRITRTAAATGAFTFNVLNYNAAVITSLNAGQTAEFLFNGTDWSLIGKVS